jgi:hypothetical protein
MDKPLISLPACYSPTRATHEFHEGFLPEKIDGLEPAEVIVSLALVYFAERHVARVPVLIHGCLQHHRLDVVERGAGQTAHVDFVQVVVRQMAALNGAQCLLTVFGARLAQDRSRRPFTDLDESLIEALLIGADGVPLVPCLFAAIGPPKTTRRAQQLWLRLWPLAARPDFLNSFGRF